MKRLFFLIFIFLFNNLSLQAKVIDYSDYAESSVWIKLLHYQKKGEKFEGLVVNNEFYLSSNGRNDPLAELEAEVVAFSKKNDDKKCTFPARFEWLKKKGLLRGNLDNCAEYQNFMNDVQPQGITLIFTNAYMRNPASLFGHTLIRIDTARKGSQMLAHGINFGADSGTERGMIFAMKGLFGGYMGVYSIRPYWDIINTYNNIENRDIWEYHLNLTDEEKKQFVDHLYEMRDAKIQYFFLNKNCSYMILEMLEAVRPQLQLTDEFDWWAIPLDTLKKVKNVPGLVNEINYRPARYTKLQEQISKMTDEQMIAFKQGIEEHNYEMKNLSPTEKTSTLETLYQYYQYQYIAKEMQLQEYRKNSFTVLRKRSVLPAMAEQQLNGTDPTTAHETMQISISNGENLHRNFIEFSLQPAYTALTDNNSGLIEGAGLKVLESKWRYYEKRHQLLLEQFTILDIMSLAPADDIFSPWSYSSNIGIKHIYNPQTLEEGYVAAAHFGMGKTFEMTNWFWIYGILNAKGEYGGFMPHNQFVALQPVIGIFNNFECWRWQLEVKRNIATQTFGNRLIYNAEAVFDITRNLALFGKYESERPDHGYNRQEFSFGLRYSF